MKRHIPNAVTCGNLISGCLGVIMCFEGQLYLASSFILLGALFDFFDGFVARLLKVSSPMGKELDSLADMVTFGFLPGMIMLKLIYNGPAEGALFQISLIALAIPLFSALRLAKFNVDTRQSDQFIGVPTPANALFIASLPFIRQNSDEFTNWLFQTPVLAVLTLVLSFLLVSPLPLLALKFKDYKWQGNQFRFMLIIGSVAAIAIARGWLAVPFIFVLYILLSEIALITSRRKS